MQTVDTGVTAETFWLDLADTLASTGAATVGLLPKEELDFYISAADALMLTVGFTNKFLPLQ